MSKTPREQIEDLTKHLSPDERREIAAHLTNQPEQTQPSTAMSLLKYSGRWQGDDLEECLELVYETRSKTEF